jgi:large subunit ribosomal protein L31e
MAKKESKTEIERTYNVPLRQGFRHTASYKKSAKAMRTLKEFLCKHMKAEDVLIGAHLNEYLWKHGIKNPPHHVKVHVWKKGDEVKAELEGFEFKGAIRSEKKKEPETMKDKLAAKLGVDANAKPESKKDSVKESVKESKDSVIEAKAEVVEDGKIDEKSETKKEAAPKKRAPAKKKTAPKTE